MTITSRVSGIAGNGNTKRVAGLLSVSNLLRVLTDGGTAAIPSSLSSDTWGRTWGLTWGRSWFTASAAVAGTSAFPAIDLTERVVGDASGGQTKRVASFEDVGLALEGDMAVGSLLLEDGDSLLVEGDMATFIISPGITQRVAGPVP